MDKTILLRAGLAALISGSFYASVLLGVPLSTLLLLLAGAPLFVVGLVHHPLVAVFSSLIAAFVIALFLSGQAGLVYALGTALPALAIVAFSKHLLVRDQQNLIPRSLGLLVVFTAGVATLTVLAGLLGISTDYSEMQKTLSEMMGNIYDISLQQIQALPENERPPVLERETLTGVLVGLLPLFSVFFILTMLLTNFWLGAKIAHRIDGDVFAWPQISALALPTATPIIIAICGFVAWIASEGWLELAALSLLTALFTCMVISGLAVLHSTTRGIKGRPFLLAGLYFALSIFPFGLIILIAVAILEDLFGLRARARLQSMLETGGSSSHPDDRSTP